MRGGCSKEGVGHVIQKVKDEGGRRDAVRLVVMSGQKLRNERGMLHGGGGRRSCQRLEMREREVFQIWRRSC